MFQIISKYLLSCKVCLLKWPLPNTFLLSESGGEKRVTKSNGRRTFSCQKQPRFLWFIDGPNLQEKRIRKNVKKNMSKKIRIMIIEKFLSAPNNHSFWCLIRKDKKWERKNAEMRTGGVTNSDGKKSSLPPYCQKQTQFLWFTVEWEKMEKLFRNQL